MIDVVSGNDRPEGNVSLGESLGGESLARVSLGESDRESFVDVSPAPESCGEVSPESPDDPHAPHTTTRHIGTTIDRGIHLE
jgi:hypothetical protein